VQRRDVRLTRPGGRGIAARAAALVVAAASASAARTARADSCTSPDLIETIPADGAQGVPPNATLSARYASIAQYTGEPVAIEHVGADTQAVTATFDAAEGILSVVPPTPLVPGDRYVVHWPGLRGLDTATLGAGADQHLQAGVSDDTKAPTFAGLTGVAWDVTREKDACTDAIDERYVFDLELGAAADDASRDFLTLLVFQTAGPKVTPGSPQPVLVQRVPPAGATARLSSVVDRVEGHVCFAAIVRDLTGQVSTGGGEVCVDTVSPPFFYGCAVASGRRSELPAGAGAGALVGVIAIAVARRRARRGADGR
jgi:hypothetical protein